MLNIWGSLGPVSRDRALHSFRYWAASSKEPRVQMANPLGATRRIL